MNNPMNGINVGVGNINALNGTDIGLLRDKHEHDKSTYKVETKADGTVVETVKMNTKSTNKGFIDLQTDGVTLGQDAAIVGISEKATEDVVGFVDSIWGSKQAAAKTADNRMQEIKQQPTQEEIEQSKEEQILQNKLENFRQLKELQRAEDALVRQQQNQIQQANIMNPNMIDPNNTYINDQITRGL